MINTFKTYFQKYYNFESLFQKSRQPDDSVSFNKFRLSTWKRLVMYALQISPIVCFILFAVIFLIQLASETGIKTGWVATVGNVYKTYPIFPLLYIIAVSGLIGYGTNYIAIRMLFRPLQKRPVWGQGLIPAQRDRIIYTLAQGMHKHVLNEELIRKRVEETGLVKKVNNLVMDGTSGLVQDDELRETLKKMVFDYMTEYAHREDVRKEIREIIDQRLENNLDGGLKKFLLQTYKKYNKEEYQEVIDKIVRDIPQIAMEVIGKMEQQLDRVAAYIRLQKGFTEKQIMNIFVDLLNRVDITELLAKQMEHFDEAKLERMVWEATNEQLLYIQYLGTILGILGGLLIWKPLLMGGIFLIGFSLLWIIDVLIFRLQRNR
ncbi:MAG: DUF445 family protein [Bacteroidia bacterium]|nr:DUF445 family protein [Bacteroidia bacterium]